MKCEKCGRLTHKLDDWDEGVPDAWDYEIVLVEHGVIVEKNTHGYYSLSWVHGFMSIPTENETHAKKAAALFVELWLRGVSASFSDKLMDGYIAFLEIQDEDST